MFGGNGEKSIEYRIDGLSLFGIYCVGIHALRSGVKEQSIFRENNMSGYLYETHMHTSPASGCSDTKGREYIPRYIDAGYSGMIITDHFFHGNTGIDRSLPWREFVNGFCAGYEDALNEGIKRNFPVFFGWEETFQGDDYLVYGLDKQWLLDHPEVIRYSRKEQYEQVKAAGGCVVQAHPFREAHYIPAINLCPELADGIEIFNAGNEMKWNSLAFWWAGLLDLPVTAGSDNHHANRMCPENLAGVILDHPLECIQDYVKVIKEQQPIGLRIPVPVPEWTVELQPNLPAVWYDREENPTGIRVMDSLLKGEIVTDGQPEG